MSCVLRRCAWDERGSRNEKVVSSVDTSTVTITILHQSPFRFAVAAAGYVVAVETASHHEERLYRTPNLLSLVIDDRFSTHSSIRESTIFRARFRHASDDKIFRPRLHAHTRRSIEMFHRYLLGDASDSSPSGNNRARLNTVTFS